MNSTPATTMAIATFAFAGAAVQLSVSSPQELVAALKLFGLDAGTPAADPDKPATEKVTPIRPPKDKPPAAASAPAAATQPSAATAQTAAPAEKPIEYAALFKAVTSLAGVVDGEEKVGRAACAELLAQFEVKTFKDLAPARWAEALAAVNAKLQSLAEPAVA